MKSALCYKSKMMIEEVLQSYTQFFYSVPSLVSSHHCNLYDLQNIYQRPNSTVLKLYIVIEKRFGFIEWHKSVESCIWGSSITLFVEKANTFQLSKSIVYTLLQYICKDMQNWVLLTYKQISISKRNWMPFSQSGKIRE